MDGEQNAAEVFISYRRNEKSSSTAALYWALKGAGFSCFYDRDRASIPSGAMWDREIERAIDNCKVMLLVIEDNFFSSLDHFNQQRIRSSNDVFASEIKRGLKRAKTFEMTLIPVVVGGKMPSEESLPEALKPLAFVHGEEYLDVDLPDDIGRVVVRIQSVLQSHRDSEGAPPDGIDRTHERPVAVVRPAPEPARPGPEPTIRFDAAGVIGVLDTAHGLELLKLIGNQIACGGSLVAPRLQRKLPIVPTSSCLSSDGTLVVVADNEQVLAIDITSDRIDFDRPAPLIGEGILRCCWRSRGKINVAASTDEGEVQWRFDSSRSSVAKCALLVNGSRRLSVCEIPGDELGFAAINARGEIDLPSSVSSTMGEISRNGWLSLDCGCSPPNKNWKSGVIAGLRAEDGDYYLVVGSGDSKVWTPFTVSPIIAAAAVHVVRPMTASGVNRVFVSRGDDLLGWECDQLTSDPQSS